MPTLHERHNTKIEAQPLHDLNRAWRMLVDEEVELESRLDIIKEVKAKIMIEIEIKLNYNRP